MKKLLNGEYIEMTEEEIQELINSANEQSEEVEELTNDKVGELAKGLSKVNTIEEVRDVAQNILNE